MCWQYSLGTSSPACHLLVGAAHTHTHTHTQSGGLPLHGAGTGFHFHGVADSHRRFAIPFTSPDQPLMPLEDLSVSPDGRPHQCRATHGYEQGPSIQRILLDAAALVLCALRPFAPPSRLWRALLAASQNSMAPSGRQGTGAARCHRNTATFQAQRGGDRRG